MTRKTWSGEGKLYTAKDEYVSDVRYSYSKRATADGSVKIEGTLKGVPIQKAQEEQYFMLHLEDGKPRPIALTYIHPIEPCRFTAAPPIDAWQE